MKKLIKGVFFLALIGTVVVGCEKEEIQKASQTNITDNEASVNELIANIRKDASKKTKSIPNPSNTNNSYDSYGMYYQNMIVSINNSELTNPSNSSNVYQSKYEDYLLDSPYQGSFPTIDFEYSELFVEITELIIEYSTEDAVSDAINGLLAVENNIFNSSLLTDNQKLYLLSLSSSLKYSRYTIAEYGLTIDGITVEGNEGLKLSAACFDQAFSNGVHAVYSNFVDTDNPGNMVLAWAGFGGTIVAGIGNGFYRGIKDCW